MRSATSRQSGVSAQVLSIKPVLFYACRSSFAQILQFCARAMVLIIFEQFCPFFVQKWAFLLLFYVRRPLNGTAFYC